MLRTKVKARPDGGFLYSGADWSTQRGAEALAEQIKVYWILKGFSKVDVWVEHVIGVSNYSAGRGGPIWTTKSNLKGGYPPK